MNYKKKNSPVKKNKGKSAVRAMSLTDKVLSFLKNNPGKPMNVNQVCSKLEISVSDKDSVFQSLQSLVLIDEVEEVQPGKFVARKPHEIWVGKVDYNSSGNAYIVSAESEKDIFVHAKNLADAWHGDTVEVVLLPRRGSSPEGVVTQVISRGKEDWVGVVYKKGDQFFVQPDSNRLPFKIQIPEELLHGASPRMKVVVHIQKWPHGREGVATGEILRILGNAGENNTEMHAILEEYGLPYEFDPEVEKEAELISFDLPEEEIKKRRDFRDVLTFTIDPADAKDFDDALSIRELEDGNYEVGVHIADVSYYVRPKSRLDQEAVKRATSVYLVDRVVPMLPEKLSNGVCSLRPNEDKFTFSAVFVLNKEGKVISDWFGRTVIHSDQRFSYEEAQEIIEGKSHPLSEPILLMHEWAQKMRKKRFDSGALRVDAAEVKFRLDEEGRPIEVYFKVQKEANQLIEEFMLLANRKVTEFVSKMSKKKPFVYRIHDLPAEAKLQDFASFVKTLGYHLDLQNPKKISKNINALLDEVKGKPEGDMVRQLAIRSMAKAIYSTKNIGHYGLAFDDYTHFTSPIRRYPDVLVHRLLDAYLNNQDLYKEADLEKLCNHSSEREKLASEAERSSIKYKQVEFMLDKVGRTYLGVITGVTEWGIYVEIEETRCEGMVRIRDMRDDFYYFDEKRMSIVGRSRKKAYRLGDKVQVLVDKVDMDRRQIDLILENF